MSLFDRLKEMWDKSAETAKEEADKAKKEAQKRALKAAANQAMAAAGAAIASAGDAFLDRAEAELASAQEARGGRGDVRPEVGGDDILARVRGQEAEARQGARDAGLNVPETASEREARARVELERLKAQLKDD